MTTTTTTEDVTTTTTTVMYSLQTNYTSNGYTFRESSSPTSQVVTQDSVMGTQTGAYLMNESYLHPSIEFSQFNLEIDGRPYGGSTGSLTINFANTPYISGDGGISVSRVNTPSGDILQVTTSELNPNSVFNISITVVTPTTTTTTTEDVTTTTTTEDVTTTTTTEDVTTTTTTEDVTTTTTTEDVTTTTTTEDVTTTTTTEDVTTTTTYSLPPSYQYFKSTVLPNVDNVCEEPGYEVTSPFWVDESGYSIPNLLGKPIFINPELSTPVMDGYYATHGQPINTTDMSPIRWIQVIGGTVSDVGVTDCYDETPI